MTIDLTWWQALIGILALLGLSPAPWIAAILAGRLMTLKQHTLALDEMHRTSELLEKRHDATIQRINEERNYERAAKDIERERSDKLAEKLMSVTEEFGATTLHLLRSLPEVDDGAA